MTATGEGEGGGEGEGEGGVATDGLDGWPGDTDGGADPWGDTDGGLDTGGGDVDPVCDGPVGAGACAQVTRCDAFGCGGKSEGLDHYGCERRGCTAYTDCLVTEHCHSVALDEICVPGAETCADADGECECTASNDCAGNLAAHCLPVEVYPPEEDCDPSLWPCAELFARQGAVVDAHAHHASAGNIDLETSLAQCSERLAMARIDPRCAETPCQLVCEIGSCDAYEDVETCVLACESLVAQADAGAIDAVLRALAGSPPLDGACACSACDTLDTDLCAGLWGC
jgi:hypothetical protein